jgi:carboxylesterase type B
LDSNTVYDASQIGPACYQDLPQSLYAPYNQSFAYTPQGVSENCLTVDVLIPTHPVSKYLPVMAQIHGGGYTSGNAQSYPGDAMVHASDGKYLNGMALRISLNSATGNMIYVSIQYRLGMWGFLSGSEVAQNGVLNAGLLDQRAALEWIQRNIRAFGESDRLINGWSIASD